MLGTNRHLAKTCRTREGFTLVELLVVIAIISILASILFPVFSQARERARRTSCLSNLKQIGLAYMQYSQDYDEKLLPGYSDEYAAYDVRAWWFNKIQPYIRSQQILKCPSARPGDVTNYAVLMLGYRTTSGALPPVSCLNWNGGGYKATGLAQAARPSETMVLIENSYCDVVDCSPNPAASTGLTGGDYFDPTTYDWATNYPGRHQGGHNALFVDGHAKWKQAVSFRGRDFYLNESPETGWTGW